MLSVFWGGFSIHTVSTLGFRVLGVRRVMQSRIKKQDTGKSLLVARTPKPDDRKERYCADFGKPLRCRALSLGHSVHWGDVPHNTAFNEIRSCGGDRDTRCCGRCLTPGNLHLLGAADKRPT